MRKESLPASGHNPIFLACLAVASNYVQGLALRNRHWALLGKPLVCFLCLSDPFFFYPGSL